MTETTKAIVWVSMWALIWLYILFSDDEGNFPPDRDTPPTRIL